MDRFEKIASNVVGGKVAASDMIVGKGIEEAISALQYLPTSAVYLDRAKNNEFAKRMKAIVAELYSLLGELPVPVKYVAYIGSESVKTTDVSELMAFMSRHGQKFTCYTVSNGMTHKWLVNQPQFDGMAGPVGDGPNVARYDTWEAFRHLSR